ncbi:molybdopterin molybdenumtransferase [Natronomonas pharaonis DSM 2160]|uniref:Molybdopterin molybdenumtransferase n=1 Tax=Natronomonas pharaonis (strain ATCC 35678 / DSM 2160 / CIP 103997 / JCM 8858 / NBRC 14720 / NCIMB 2260 / Gabara) TaxID=348780 RepID=A0A1U7EUY4_NATPD|nr:molybdopterin biosynthesis protein [Natronomonas pharaonis]CAI48812.1 molybdopterin molybdenumtransferase [Natronomonas pharaonis DSM 2160]
MSRKQFRDLADPETARETIASLDLAPEPTEVPLREARGRVLASRIDAELDVPGFDRASVDGYAVRAADTFGADEADPAELELAGAVHAGVEPSVEVAIGECVEVSTGAVVPPGADAVVMVERTDEDAGVVSVRTALAPGDGVMFAGADVAAGERALGPGTVLTPREIGLLSALGVDSVPVRGQPTVGIISTGDELVRPGGDLDSSAGEIYDVNSYTIATAVEAAGGEARLYPHAGDDYEAMESVLREAADDCDLVLSSGSTSASAVDVIYRVIEDTGELLLHGVAVKPGKPMLVGRIADSAYIGLPGYPVSALTIFRTFVAPAVREAAGLPEPETATVSGEMAVRERYSEGRQRYMPAGLVADGDGTTLVYPVDKGSGATTSLVEADGVVSVPPDVEYLDAGERVTVHLFSPDVRPPALFGAGEDDPALSRLLDRVDRPRHLGVGSRQGRRRLRDGVTDIAVVTGDADIDGAVTLGGWRRQWGLVVPAGNPDDVSDLSDLVDRELRFVNRTTDSGLRGTLETALESLAADRDRDVAGLFSDIDGFGLAVRAHESPARKVRSGDADAGLGLRATAEKLGLGFVPCGTEQVQVLADASRTGKDGVEAFRQALDDLPAVAGSLPGYDS